MMLKLKLWMWLAGLIFLLAMVARPSNSHAAGAVDRASGGVPAQRLRHLLRGVNLSGWFSQVYGSGDTAEHVRSYITARDISLIHEMGMDHVRIPVNPRKFFRLQEHGVISIPPRRLREFDAAIRLVLAHDLAVIVDIHPDHAFTKSLAANRSTQNALVRLWGLLAANLAYRFNPNRVFLEVLNEPTAPRLRAWEAIQLRVVEAIRKSAPNFTIIATGTRWSSIRQLCRLKPLPYSDIVYNFHFYQPGAFAQQGAQWAYPPWKFIRGLPYPSSPKIVAPIAARVENPAARSIILKYGRQRWNGRRINDAIAKAAAWGRKYKVPLICDEFGVFAKYAPPRSRADWIHDVRIAFERYHIGWTMWDYCGGFHLVKRQGDQIIPDRAIVKALGLRMPREPGSVSIAVGR